MVPHFNSTSRRDWLTDIVSLGFLFTLFYLLWLGNHPLFTPDEGRYSEVAREMVETGDYITPRVNGVAFLDKPILYYWLQAAAIQLFGLNEWALRFFPALFGIIGCLITYICGRHLFNRRTGIVAAIILATSPLYFANARYADLDLEVATLISSALLFFITAIQAKPTYRPFFLAAAYLFTALAFLTKGLIGLAFPAMIVGSWIVFSWRFKAILQLHLIIGAMLFLAIAAPWYWLAEKANPGFFHYFFVTQQVTRFLSVGEFNNPTPFWFYIPVVLIGFFPWTIFLIRAIRFSIHFTWQTSPARQVELFLLLWITIIFIFFSIPHSKIIGYILPIFPALALLVGHYLSDRWENWPQQEAYWAILTFVITGVGLGFFILALPHYNLLTFSPYFLPYLMTIATTLMISGLGSLFFIRKNFVFPIFITCATCSILFLLTLTMGATYLNQNTAKPLIDQLKIIIQPQDEIITYFKYYQDIPLYLERRITIVADWQAPDITTRDNWVREFWYGKSFQPTDDWLIDEKTFWQRFKSKKRVFVFLNANYFSQFKSKAQFFFQLGRFHDIILVSNQKIKNLDDVNMSHSLPKNP